MIEFGAEIKLDSISATEQMRKFAGQTTAASKALKQFQKETKATAQGSGANVFRSYINSSQRANQQILKSITLIHDQRKAFSKLSDSEKEHIAIADKLNLKYDEAARAERKLVNIRKELRIVTASGLKTQKEADAIFNREAEIIRKSTRAYKEKNIAAKKAAAAVDKNKKSIREAMIAHNKNYAIHRKVMVVKKQLILLLKNEKIDRAQYNRLLTESRKKITAVVRENHKMISSQQRMVAMARLVSVYSRILLGVYAAMRTVKMWVDFEKTAESIKLLSQKLEFLTGDSGAYKKLFDMTQDVGIKMESANKIITRFGVVTNRAFSIETMSEWSATLIKSARATGTSTQEMTGALIQITQAMSAGRLMGDEYRSVTENLPLVTVALRDMFGRSTSSLKELSSQGLITNEVLIEAFGRTKVLLEGFPDSTKTIEASFGRLSSSWDNFISKLVDSNVSKDFANSWSETFNTLSDKLDVSKVESAEALIERRSADVIRKEKTLRGYLNEQAELLMRGKETDEIEEFIDFKRENIKEAQKALEDSIDALDAIHGRSKGDLAKKAADDRIQAIRKQNEAYKQQLITIQFIEKIQGGKSIATIKRKAELDRNLLLQKQERENDALSGGVTGEQFFVLADTQDKNKQLAIDKVIQKQIDSELRLSGFTTKNNIEKIEEELRTTGKIRAIKLKAEKDRKSIDSERRAREIWLTKKDRDESNKRGITGDKASILTGDVNLKEIKDIKDHIDSVTASLNSVGDAALSNTAKMKGDITAALGFDKASIVSDYGKKLVDLENKFKQLGSAEEYLAATGKNLNEERLRQIAVLKELMEATLIKKDDDFTANLESKFDSGAVAIRRYEKEVINLNAAKDRLNLSEAEHNRQLMLLNKSMDDQVDQSKSLRGELNHFEQVFRGMNKGMEDFALNTQTTYEYVAGATESLMDSMADSIAIGGKQGEDSFRRMTESVLKDIQRMIIKSLILKAIGIFTGNASGMEGVNAGSQQDTMLASQNADFNAKGGMYSGPGISSYSNTIVDKPTLFPFAKGTGLMGEAGEEAIMPLTRMASGNLGVESTNSGQSVDNNVTIIVKIDQSGNTEQETETSEDDSYKLGSVISAAVNKQLVNEMRPGGLLNKRGIN